MVYFQHIKEYILLLSVALMMCFENKIFATSHSKDFLEPQTLCNICKTLHSFSYMYIVHTFAIL